MNICCVTAEGLRWILEAQCVIVNWYNVARTRLSNAGGRLQREAAGATPQPAVGLGELGTRGHMSEVVTVFIGLLPWGVTSAVHLQKIAQAAYNDNLRATREGIVFRDLEH